MENLSLIETSSFIQALRAAVIDIELKPYEEYHLHKQTVAGVDIEVMISYTTSEKNYTVSTFDSPAEADIFNDNIKIEQVNLYKGDEVVRSRFDIYLQVQEIFQEVL